MSKIIKLFNLLLLVFILSNLTLISSVKSEQVNNLKVKDEGCKPGNYYWVIYDNVCPYCQNATKHIKSLDWEGKFKFLSYRNPLTYKMFPNLKKEECEKDVHMVTPDGKILIGYMVFREIIDNLTATKILNPLLKNNYAEKQLNEIYEKMVKERSCYYNKSDTCELKPKSQANGML